MNVGFDEQEHTGSSSMCTLDLLPENLNIDLDNSKSAFYSLAIGVRGRNPTQL
jgi:hypothetical protein